MTFSKACVQKYEFAHLLKLITLLSKFQNTFVVPILLELVKFQWTGTSKFYKQINNKKITKNTRTVILTNLLV